MNVTPVTNTDEYIRLMREIREYNQQIYAHRREVNLRQERERITEQRLEHNREQLFLEQLYYERAHNKAQLVKGTNIDLYV